MMKKLLICCFLPLASCLVSGWAWSQQPRPAGIQATPYSDSLQRALHKHRSDSSRIATLFLLSDYWSDKDTSLALRYVRDAAKLSRPGSFQQALVYFYTGGAYFDTDITKSEEAYLTSEKMLRRFAGKEALIFRSRAWNNYGVLQQVRDNEKRYAEIMLKHAIPLAQKAGDSARVANNYHNLGIVFSNQLDYKKAETYYSTAISLMRGAAPASLELADAYMYGAKNQIYQKKYEPVRAMLDSASAILAQHEKPQYWIEFYMVEGMYHTRIKQYARALISFEHGLSLAKKLGRDYDSQSIRLQIYFTYKAMGSYQNALKLVRELATEKTDFPKVDNQKLFYYELSEMLDKTGNHKEAYRWLHDYAELADSLFTEGTRSEITALETKYQSVEKERKIGQLQAKNEKAALTIKNNRLVNWLLAVVCVFLLAVTVLVLLFYRNNKRLWQQQRQLHEMEMQKIRQDYKISMLSAMLEGQEQERTRLARDLHDGLGGLLSSIKIELSQTVVEQEQRIKRSIGRTLSHLDDAVNELRRIARSLMPEILMNYGLAEATREFCKNLKGSGINLVCQVFNYKDSLPKEKQIVLYRIIQELVNNAVKHATASQILVIIQQSGETLFVTVEDDGKGFDPENTNGKAGAGLSNVKARADFLNAKFEMQSSPKSGTSVTVECEV